MLVFTLEEVLEIYGLDAVDDPVSLINDFKELCKSFGIIAHV